jgi:putrescine transport system substrate-binding protein
MITLLGACAEQSSGPELRVYNWNDYIAPEVIDRFEEETGIRVVYDVFDSNEVLEAKLLSGASGYDIVVPTSDFMGRQIVAGVFRALDLEKLPNYGNLNPELMELIASFDPGNRYGIPYLWGTTGIGYNADLVQAALGDDAPVDSLDLIFKPEYASKLADCGIALLDSPSEVFSAVLNYLGFDPNSTDAELYENQARELLEAVRPSVRYFHSSQYINDLANGEICVALGWSGDVLQARDRAREAGNGVQIAFRTPREGALMWFDMLAIPADSRNVDYAHRFINYLLQPEVIAEISAFVKYANANDAATTLLPKAITADEAIYPSAAVRERLYTDTVTPPKIDRVMTRVWTAVKTGK